MLLELADERVANLAVAVVCWSMLWALVLISVPAGERGRNHIITLNAAHGVVSTLASTTTLYFSLDTTVTVAASLAFFLVDLVAMVNADGLARLATLRRSRLMDYGHHLLGLYWGVVFFSKEKTMCDASFGNPYVWIQTNEVSTGFYNWYRLTDSVLAGALFASSFFLSRVVFNTLYLVPRIASNCQQLYLLACAPFFLLQYAWFYMIASKLVSGAPSKTSTTLQHADVGTTQVETKKSI